MVVRFLFDGPEAGGKDFLLRQRTRLMPVVDNEPSVLRRNPRQLSQKLARLLNHKEHVERAQDIGDVIGQSGAITVRQDRHDILQTQFFTFLLDGGNSQFVDIDGVDVTLRPNEF